MKNVVVHLIFFVQKDESGQEKQELLCNLPGYVKLWNPSCLVASRQTISTGRAGENG